MKNPITADAATRGLSEVGTRMDDMGTYTPTAGEQCAVILPVNREAMACVEYAAEAIEQSATESLNSLCVEHGGVATDVHLTWHGTLAEAKLVPGMERHVEMFDLDKHADMDFYVYRATLV